MLCLVAGDATSIPHPGTRSVAAGAPAAPHASGEKIYDFIPADSMLLGPNGGTTAARTLTSNTVLGLYFSAHW